MLSLSDGFPFLEFLIKRLAFLSCVIILMLVVRVIISYYKFSNAGAWAANAINVLNFLSPTHAALCFYSNSFNLGCVFSSLHQAWRRNNLWFAGDCRFRREKLLLSCKQHMYRKFPQTTRNSAELGL